MGQVLTFLKCIKSPPKEQQSTGKYPSKDPKKEAQISNDENNDDEDDSTDDINQIPAPYINALKNHPQFFLLSPLGMGGYGFVAKARDLQTNQKVAIKFIDIKALKQRSNKQKIQTMKTRIQREIKYHQRLSGHPNIVEFKCMFVTRQYLCIVMEFARGGNLLQYLNKYIREKKKFSEDEARYWFQQLIFGIKQIQDEKIVNRDLKLENILIQLKNGEKILKLCDFGFAKDVDMDSRAMTQVGSWPYMAPEVFFPEDFADCDSQQRDTWACGIILYTLLYQQFPFEQKGNKNMLKYMQNVRWARFRYPQDVEISKQAKDLIGKLLVPNPQARLSVKQVMKHAWFKQNLPQIPRVFRKQKSVNQPEEEIDQLVDDIFNNKGSLNKYQFSLVRGSQVFGDDEKENEKEEEEEGEGMGLEDGVSEMIDFEIDIVG